MPLAGTTGRVMLLAAALLLPAVLAQADVNQQNASAAWKAADQCARDAFKKFPDHTPTANSQRETARRQCLRNHKLPEPAAAPQASGDPPSGDPPSGEPR